MRKIVVMVLVILVLCFSFSVSYATNLDSGYGTCIAVEWRRNNQFIKIVGKLEYTNKSIDIISFNEGFTDDIVALPQVYLITDKQVIVPGVHRIRGVNQYGTEAEGTIDFRVHEDPKITWLIDGVTLITNISQEGLVLKEKIIPDIWLGRDFTMVHIFDDSTDHTSLSAQSGIDKGEVALKKGDDATDPKELRPLAEQGNPEAQYHLGVMYNGGYGVPKDMKEAMKWYEKSAKQGCAYAEVMLGTIYRYGAEGVEQNSKLALEFYLKAAKRGDADAQLDLGLLYKDGNDGIPQNYNEAVEWFRKLADQGDPRGYYHLGEMYLKGYGVSKDLVQAYRWFSLCVEAVESPSAKKRRDRLVEYMTPSQIAEAQRLAKEWKPKGKN